MVITKGIISALSIGAGEAMNHSIERAIDCLQNGRFVLLYDSDDRERETDMVIASEFVTPAAIRTMRKDAGGLICTTATHDISVKLGLPFLADVLSEAGRVFPVLERLCPNDIPYDTKSAFSITINHRKTFTGITDIDRAMTTSEFARLAKRSSATADEEAQKDFGLHFRSPGHVHLLRASAQLLTKRRGHTELSTALLSMSRLTQTATICEMMGDDGNALSKDRAKDYAMSHDLCFLEGSEVIAAWQAREGP